MSAEQQKGKVPELSAEEKKKQTWGEYGSQVYNEQYERWMPWIEDFYLRWFTKDNKASYATKGKSNSSTVRVRLRISRTDLKPAHAPHPSPRGVLSSIPASSSFLLHQRPADVQ